MRNKQYILLLLFAVFIITACSDNDKDNAPQNVETELSILVLSDLHYFDPELGAGETAFYYDKMSDAKLADISKYITEAYFEAISQNPANTLIITGDLTCNGETYNHEKVIEFLKKCGKRVFVIPGNHDINSPFAYRYEGSQQTKIATPTAEEFARMYADFGFKQAFSRDVNSLSYAANLDSHFVLLALDVCRYEENTATTAISGGHLKIETLKWISEVLESVYAGNKQAIVAMHHGLIEHFPGQMLNPVTSNYLLDNATDLINILNKYGVHCVLTGHFHANDIVKFGGTDLYDIETGSALTYPHSWREITLSKNKIKVQTFDITHISHSTSPAEFVQYSIEKSSTALYNYFNKIWKSSGLSVPDSIELQLHNEFAKAILAHYHGDEQISPKTEAFAQELISSGNTKLAAIGYALRGVYTDPAPADRNTEIIFND